MEKVVDALGRLLDDQPLAQLGILRRHADRAAAGVAVVALTGGDANGALVVRDPGISLLQFSAISAGWRSLRPSRRARA